MRSLQIEHLVTNANFDEDVYLASNPDVAEAVAAGFFGSGRHHFEIYGSKENRHARFTAYIASLRRTKMERLLPTLRLDLPHLKNGEKYDFLTAELRLDCAVIDTHNVSAHAYSTLLVAMVSRYSEGLILDCGAGKRNHYYDNVVNYDIVDYDSTDVIGVGERLPFKDGVFDAVISIAVLEHVRDPFACAAEIVRVLKPGGELVCSVPFLQPLHGFPHHYYNMTPQGLQALFERSLVVDSLTVPEAGLPIWSLAWIVSSWADGLQEPARSEFLSLQLKDLHQHASVLLDKTWVKGLSSDKNIELAAATLLRAHKTPS
jgi:SAM-dependent methyltransferase